jgi:hypothetical protein
MDEIAQESDRALLFNIQKALGKVSQRIFRFICSAGLAE